VIEGIKHRAHEHVHRIEGRLLHAGRALAGELVER
jgi:hypothetical protein